MQNKQAIIEDNMRSMTGFGKGVAETDERKVTIEIKTVNHKQLQPPDQRQ